ncbi:MAG: DUF1501 domain-containing protein [Pseudomonadota bacterium]
MTLSRRAFLGTACSAAASPLVTPMVFAATPGENRLVVIVLRGGLDGLGAVQPYGDRDFTALRPGLATRPGDGLSDLDGFFGLADPFRGLLPLWQAGELGFVHAISTPYRDKRSHFDGQDLLENGGGATDGSLTRTRDGWLNRAVGLIPGARAETAMAVGREHMLLLEGAAPALSWSPTNALALEDDDRQLLTALYSGDPLFSEALAEAAALADDKAETRRESGATLARYTAERLNADARIAAFSLGGWDTHRRQANAIRNPAKQLTEALTTLKQDLGRNWNRTAVIAITEFGRTARENGSGGTDHGTGGLMVVSGGAVQGGRVFGDWPGLSERDLYQNRDLMPTDDLRRWAAWPLAAMFGLDRATLERTVFPGVDLGREPGLIL